MDSQTFEALCVAVEIQYKLTDSMFVGRGVADAVRRVCDQVTFNVTPEYRELLRQHVTNRTGKR